jgi:hypothetical protein
MLATTSIRPPSRRYRRRADGTGPGEMAPYQAKLPVMSAGVGVSRNAVFVLESGKEPRLIDAA